MNCREFEKQWAELEDADRLGSNLEEHRRICRSCSEMLEDVNYIREQARSLSSAQSSFDGKNEPPEHLWLNIRARLVEEGLVSKPRRGLPGWLLAPAPQMGWFQRFSTGLAYAAVFGVAVGVMYLHSLLQVPAPPMLASTPSVPAMALAKGGAPSPDQDVQELARQVAPEQREVFVSNWNQVNSSIQQLNDSHQQNPDDPFIDEELMNAFQQRQRLLDTFIRWEEF